LLCHRAEFGDDVDLYECQVADEVDFVSAGVKGTFTCTGRLGYRDRETPRCSDRVAMRCNGMNVKGDLRLGDPDDRSRPGKIEIYGEAHLVAANVEGEVNLTNALIANADGTALDAEHLIVGDNLYLDQRFQAEGLVRLVGARVSGIVNCTNGVFRNEHGPAIDADGLVATSVYLNSRDYPGEEKRRGFLAEGGIRLEGARVTQAVDCTEGTFSSERGPAIDAAGLVAREMRCTKAKITAGEPGPWGAVAIEASSMQVANFFLDWECEVSGGTVRLIHAKATGEVYLTFCRVEAPDGVPSINADGAEFGRLFLQGGFTGEVSLAGAAIRRELNCTGGHFRNARGYALRADRITCGVVYLNRRREMDQSFVAEGVVSLWGAKVEYVDCREGTVRGSRAVQGRPRTREGYETYALDLAEVQVGQHVWAQGVVVEGGLTVADADISGDLDLSEARIKPNDSGVTLKATNASVKGAMRWRGTKRATGRVLLNDANVGLLEDEVPGSWPSPRNLALSGLQYGALAGDVDVRKRLEWFGQSDYSAQPYEQLGRWYRLSGRQEDAIKVAMAGEKARRARASWLGKAWGWFLRATVGYGYRPQRAVFWLLLLTLSGGFLFLYAKYADLMIAPAALSAKPPIRAMECSGRYPCFMPWVYQFELLLPVVNLRAVQFWLPDASTLPGKALFAWAWATVLFGWVLAAAVAAGLSTLVKRPVS
jgi:hypothetical protein